MFKNVLKWVMIAVPAAAGAIISQLFVEHEVKNDVADILGIEEDEDDDEEDDE